MMDSAESVPHGLALQYILSGVAGGKQSCPLTRAVQNTHALWFQ